MPSKQASQRNKRKETNRVYYETHKDTILSNKKEKYSTEGRSERHGFPK